MMIDSVLVYRYTYWDPRTSTQEMSTHYATMDEIRNGLGIPVLKDSLKVERAELEGGFYYPKNTNDEPTPQRQPDTSG
jgi:hypothetical protein